MFLGQVPLRTADELFVTRIPRPLLERYNGIGNELRYGEEMFTKQLQEICKRDVAQKIQNIPATRSYLEL